jgi:hypothetical protein
MPQVTCSIPDCTKPSRARGWCWPHYQHWRRNGDAAYVAPTTEERFWAKVDKSGECWAWTGTASELGYGSFFADGDKVLAHRYSFSLAAGRPIIPGADIDHICRNPNCVRPSHLREATRKQNKENHGGAQVNSKTGVRGVYFDSQRNGYLAVIGHNGRRICLGKFDTVEAAGAAATAKRNELFTYNNADRIEA